MTNFSEKVILGRTGLSVSRLGIGAAYWVSEKACRRAFDAGVNYFFWGSLRTPGMALAIRDIARKQREDLVVVLQCYARSSRMIRNSVEKGLQSLQIDQADILLLGWHDAPPPIKILDTVAQLKEKGRYRFLGISSHQRGLFPGYLKDGRYDVFHIRYNAAHPGAEQDIFPYLPKKNSPGIVSFTNTRWGDLLKAKKMPAGTAPMSAPDCYRFALSNPHIQVAITGPKNDQELEETLTVLESGPLDDREIERMKAIGRHVHGLKSVMSTLT